MQVYRQQRNYENLNKRIFEGAGEYNTPELKSAVYEVENWISFNYARGCEEPERHGIHFFIDDYQFMRLWKNPDAYLDMLKKFQAVCTPDFSTYTDFPKAIQLYNTALKSFLQSVGATKAALNGALTVSRSAVWLRCRVSARRATRDQRSCLKLDTMR